jgi:hypothetical protein
LQVVLTCLLAAAFVDSGASARVCPNQDLIDRDLGSASGGADQPTREGLLAGREHGVEIGTTVSDAQDRQLTRIPLQQERVFEIGGRAVLESFPVRIPHLVNTIGLDQPGNDGDDLGHTDTSSGVRP